MSTRKQLSLLLSVLIGGMALLALVSSGAILGIRSEILRLSQETSPTQVRLAKLQRGFERISGAFARISAATKPAELSAISDELDQTVREVELISKSLSETGGASGGDFQAVAAMLQTGGELRQIAAERIESRRQISDANARAGREIESVAKSAQTLNDSMRQIETSSQAFLETSRKNNQDANANIKALLVAREKVEQLRSAVQEARGVDKKFRLNPLRDKARGSLDGLTVLELPDHALAGQLKSFADGFLGQFDAEGGLLTLRAGVIAAPDEAKARTAYEEKHKAIIASIEAVSAKLAEAIDPQQLAVRKANSGMSDATRLIGLVEEVSASTAEVGARAKALQALAWQLLSESDAGAVDRTAKEIGQQYDESMARLNAIQAGLSKLQQQQQLTAAVVEESRRSFGRVRDMLVGPTGVAWVVKRSIAKQEQAERLFAGALESVRNTVQTGSSRAKEAEGAEEESVNRIRQLTGATFWVVGLISVAALAAGVVVGRRVRRGILDAEDAQSRDADCMRQMLDQLQANEETERLVDRLREGVETLRVASRQLGETSEVVSKNAETVCEGAQTLEVTIREIEFNALEASDTGSGAAQLVTKAVLAVDALVKARKEIGVVTEVIRTIAFKTNLLSLNAAIQAAHAGDQGAGFAVVAREIKTLAGAASESTAEIDASVHSMGRHVEHVKQSMSELASIVSTMKEKQDVISSAVRAQTESTGWIAEGIQQTVQGCKGGPDHPGLRTMALQLGELAEDLAKLAAAQ